ncbi:DUF6238 family protein [Streptomyces sp. NPDC049881]|uniref:DUF6238 family protein n=1 Tax=Streptomyces sp. NPDC049881 TaxID=3155778 RepID=UPI0034359093
MAHTPTPREPDFLPLATTALDFHRCLTLPAEDSGASRVELTSLHAHLVALYELLDTYARRTRRFAPREADHLRAAGTRIWQAADHLHSAFHAAPRAGVTPPGPTQPRADPDRSPPGATICQRHQRVVRLVRLRTTPTDLRAPFTGAVRHRPDSGEN